MRVLLFVLLAATAVVRLRADAWSDAIDKLQAGDEAGAIQLLQGAIAKDPGAVRPNVLLSEVLLGSQRVDEARKVADAALANAPGVAEFHRILGDAEFRQGYIFEAEKAYKAASQIDPKNARAILGVARVYQTAAINHKAELLIQIAHKLDPDDPFIEAALERTEGTSPAAIARWEQVLKTMPLDPTGNGSHMAMELNARIAEAKKLAGKQPNELASAYVHYQIPLSIKRDGQRESGLGIPISVNDAKGVLELDTGAGGILINSKMAERAGVQRLADVEMGGIGSKGSIKGWLGYAEHIQIGNLELRNCIVRVSEKGFNDTGGLLGTDVFQRFLVKLNFRQYRLELDPLPGPAWDGHAQVDRYMGAELSDYAQFLRLAHYILIPTRIGDSPPVLFMADTGSSFSMISTTAASSVTRLRDNPNMRVQGISGQVKMMYSADKVTLEFAGYRQLNQNLTAFDLSNFSRNANAEITGIMGLPLLGLFASITLDYRDGRIKFDRKN